MAELKKHTARFEAIGTVKIGERTFNLNAENANKSWTYSSMNLELDCGGQICKIDLFGGFNTNEPYDIMRNAHNEWFKRGNYEGRRFVYDGDAQKRISWEDRFDKDILSTLDYGDKIKVKLGSGSSVEFITQYDLVNYLAEEVENGTALKVVGEIVFKYNEKGEVVEELQVSQIYSAFSGVPHKLTKTVRVLVDGNATEENERVKLNAFVVEYIKQIDEEKINKLIALPFELYIDKKATPKYQVYLDKIFNAEAKRYTEVVIEYMSEIEGDIKQIALDDIINESNATTIELEKLCGKTDEEILEKYAGSARRAVASGNIKVTNIFKDIRGEAKEVDGNIKTELLFTHNKYKESQIFFLEDVIQEKPEPKSPPKKAQSKQTSVSDSEIEDILNGLI